ncbi:MAG: hypothetical protein KGI52_17990, partial [Burkholderiales bacterium]|nr:hypothetical protein [Burkholderiales bacterium]
MQILQTIGELSLENGAIAAWAEPRAGQGLRPKFGARPLPKKLIYMILILEGFVFLINGFHIPSAASLFAPLI